MTKCWQLKLCTRPTFTTLVTMLNELLHKSKVRNHKLVVSYFSAVPLQSPFKGDCRDVANQPHIWW